MGRIVDVTLRGCKLHSETGRLCVDKPDGASVRIAYCDIEAVLLSERAIDLTGCVLSDLAEAGIPLVVCGKDYLPKGVLNPFGVYHAQTRVLQHQIQARSTTLARLWQLIVRRKIANQIAMMRWRRASASDLARMMLTVERGDARNAEGTAARIYWQSMRIFKNRNRDAEDANRLLNYCYAVIYSATARALCAAGLNPGLGIQHCNGYNDCCLASDVMEPFRIAADYAVVSWMDDHPDMSELTPTCKAELLRTMLGVAWRGRLGETSLSEALAETAVSLRNCFVADRHDLELPEALCA